MKLVTRAQWGAAPARGRSGSIPLGRVTIHWEGPHMGTPEHHECASRVRGIQRFHQGARDWNDIAYSAVVCPHGYVFEGRGPGVRTAANGTDAANDAWHAVCYLGGQGDPFTDAAKAGISDAVAWLRGAQVNAHRDHKPTECPGDEITRWVHAGGPLTPGDDDVPLDRNDLDAIGLLMVKAHQDLAEPAHRRTRRLLKAVALRAGMTEDEISAALNGD